MEQKLESYFKSLNLGTVSGVTELKDGNSSNHNNYKVVTSQGIFVARVTKPGDLLGYTNLSDEYTILKLVERYNIGPKAIHIDLENFENPILIEEFLDGISYLKISTATEDMLEKTIDLLVATSKVGLGFEQFPFKFTYTTFQTNFKVWMTRMEEIKKTLGDGNQILTDFNSVIDSTKEILIKKDALLTSAPKEFIYNDIHPGNLFWLPREGKTKFIDWQKVSLGNPAFMISLFARRFFAYFWGMDEKEFAAKVIKSYQDKKQVRGFEELFYASMLERAVSDMIWSVWADVKKGVAVKISKADESQYYKEAITLMSGM
ncbi:MAG: phosphotransferase [Patescibacteria group bacterium]